MQEDLQGQSMKDKDLTEEQKADREDFYALRQLQEKWCKALGESLGGQD